MKNVRFMSELVECGLSKTTARSRRRTISGRFAPVMIHTKASERGGFRSVPSAVPRTVAEHQEVPSLRVGEGVELRAGEHRVGSRSSGAFLTTRRNGTEQDGAAGSCEEVPPWSGPELALRARSIPGAPKRAGP
jgi:hypothetical protein